MEKTDCKNVSPEKLCDVLRASDVICGECPDAAPRKCDRCIVRKIVDRTRDNFEK